MNQELNVPCQKLAGIQSGSAGNVYVCFLIGLRHNGGIRCTKGGFNVKCGSFFGSQISEVNRRAATLNWWRSRLSEQFKRVNVACLVNIHLVFVSLTERKRTDAIWTCPVTHRLTNLPRWPPTLRISPSELWPHGGRNHSEWLLCSPAVSQVGPSMETYTNGGWVKSINKAFENEYQCETHVGIFPSSEWWVFSDLWPKKYTAVVLADGQIPKKILNI